MSYQGMEKGEKMPSTWTKESVKELLLKNDRAVERAILVIFNNQTKDEQQTENVKHYNGIGFLPMHARRGSYYAKWINSGKHLNGNHLEFARKMSLKYTRQLLEAIKENGK